MADPADPVHCGTLAPYFHDCQASKIPTTIQGGRNVIYLLPVELITLPKVSQNTGKRVLFHKDQIQGLRQKK